MSANFLLPMSVVEGALEYRRIREIERLAPFGFSDRRSGLGVEELPSVPQELPSQRRGRRRRGCAVSIMCANASRWS